MNRNLRLIAVLVGASLSACIPYCDSAQLRIPTTPIVFADSETSSPLDEVLVIPRYSSFTGLSTGAGHGPGGGTHRCYLADPFIYRRGDPFSPRQPKSGGLIWGPGWAFTGKGITLDGVTVVAPGYCPVWVWDLWQHSSRRNPIVLEALGAWEKAEADQFLELLHKPKLLGAETDPFGYCGGQIEIRFDADQVRLVEAFLKRDRDSNRNGDSATLPHKAVKLPVRPVTRIANSATRAPVQPADHGRR